MRHEHEGGGRRPRFFGHGDLRLVILDILTRNASHGYELIKEIENLTQGELHPEPGRHLSNPGLFAGSGVYHHYRRRERA